MSGSIKIRVWALIVVATLYTESTALAERVNPAPSERSVAKTGSYLEKIKTDTPRLIAFLNRFPKGGDLHTHVSGAGYIEFGLEYALEHGYYYDPEHLKIVPPPDPLKPATAQGCDALSDTNGCLISVQKLVDDPKERTRFLDVASVRGWHPDTANGQDHFFGAFVHTYVPGRSDGDKIARIAARSHSQGVRYLELMITSFPVTLLEQAQQSIDRDGFELGKMGEYYASLSSLLESEAFKQAVVTYMDQREEAIEQILQKDYNITIRGETPDIIIRYLPQLHRERGNRDVFLEAALSMKAASIDHRIVGLNMVQNESALRSQINFDAQMEILDYLWNRMGHPRIALHAGELVLRESPLEAMRNRIRRSIVTGHASRIGHGVSIPWETDPAATLALMKKRNVAIEICLSSNEVILGLKGKEHPFRIYKDAGVPITIATDDEGISRSNLTMEYLKAVQRFNLGYDDIQKIARNALIYSFLEGEGIYRADGTIAPRYRRYLHGEIPTVQKVGLKAYLEIRLEQDMAEHAKRFSQGYFGN